MLWTGRFAQVMVDAKDGVLLEGAEQNSVEFWAEARSRPNGFSTMTRAPLVQPDLASCSTTRPKKTGGMAR